MVNDDAPRPHTWEEPHFLEDWLICRECDGYKKLVDLKPGTVQRLLKQIEIGTALGFGERLRHALDGARNRVARGHRPQPPRDPGDTTGTFINGEPQVARRRYWELTDLYRCRGPRRPVG